MSLGVDTTRLRTHAGHVEQRMDQAQVAADAAGAVSFDADAYGLIGGLLVHPFVSAFEVAGVGATRAVVAGLGGTAAGIRTAAAGFDLVDEGVEELMQVIEEKLS